MKVSVLTKINRPYGIVGSNPTGATKMKDCCPRCISPWEMVGQTEHCLTRCGMSRMKVDDRWIFEEMYICDGIINGDDSLIWFTKAKRCVYYKKPGSSRVRLPYLEFDIESKKLKLYLTFS